jgi:hypothetical protein
MNKGKMTEHIKVNFPLTAESFAAGDGEGMWVLVDRETKAAHDADETGGVYTGILDNDSIYYPGLNAGVVVQFEMRGENRPVAIFEGFLEELYRLTPAEKEEFIRKLVEGHMDGGQATDPADPQYEGPLCCDCQFCGDKHSFPEPNNLIEMDPENPMVKHLYCCCGDCELYGKDITGMGIHECECFEEL